MTDSFESEGPEWTRLMVELLPALQLYGVADVEAVRETLLHEGSGVVLQMRDRRGRRVPRHFIPITLLDLTEKTLASIMVSEERDQMLVRARTKPE